MDRQRLMRELERIAVAEDMPGDDIRLYILLLTNCLGSAEGIIKYSTVRNAFGGKLPVDRLAKLCDNLVNKELIKLKCPINSGVAEKDFTISYIVWANKAN